MRYRVETKGEQVVDLSAIGQGEQKTGYAQISFLTITLNDTAGGLTVHAVLDSAVKADTNALPPQASLDSARGRAWHALLSPEGKLSGLKRIDDTTAVGPFGDMINNFFPRVKRGAKVGDQWTDTTEAMTDSDGQTLTTRTITNFRATGTETRSGTRALKIETAFSLAQTGEVNGPQGSFSLDGTGTGTATYFVTPDGRYLGGMSSVTSDLQVTTEQLPAPIPIHATNAVTVSVLP